MTTVLDEPLARPEAADAPRSRAPHPSVAVVRESIESLAALLDQLDGWAAIDTLLAVEGLIGRLTGVGARLLAHVEGDGLWATRGGRSVTDWLAVAAGLPYARARERVQLSHALRDHLPATAEAVLAGEVPVAHAQALARYAVGTQARERALAAPAEECGEGFLLARAHEQTADGFRHLVRRWAAAADPEADERGYHEACEREFLALSPTTGGVHLAGFLTAEHGATVAVMLAAVTPPPAEDDRRTAQQRRAAALVDGARLVLAHDLTASGADVRPHLTVAVDFDTLRRALTGPSDDGRTTNLLDTGEGAGAAFVRTNGEAATEPTCLFRLAPVADVERFAVADIVGTGPIPPSVLARLACDCEISRLVFGPDSRVINVGRAERTFTGPRRRAIVARDQTCRYPGCNAPPALGELHHIDWWVRDGGQTDANAGILLCWYHHDLVHRRAIAISRSPTGGWVFATRDGRPVTARRAVDGQSPHGHGESAGDSGAVLRSAAPPGPNLPQPDGPRESRQSAWT